MTLIEAYQQELESEVVTTRKMLALVPLDQPDWQPHPKSMKLGALAGHIAELPSWIPMALDTDELDFATANYQTPAFSSTSDLLAFFEKNVEAARATLKRFRPEQLGERWVLRTGEMIHADMNRSGLVRVSLSQLIHHRAQLGVYLRLLNIPIPGSYGPSADEMSFQPEESVAT